MATLELVILLCPIALVVTTSFQVRILSDYRCKGYLSRWASLLQGD
jgi:hypothetical protein